MSARKTALDVTLFDLPSGTHWLTLLRNAKYSAIADAEDAAGLAVRYESKIDVKQGDKISATIELDNGGTPVCNLDIQGFVLDGVELLTDVQGGSIRVSNTFADGSGVADRYKFGNALGTDLEIKAECFIDFSGLGVTTASLVAKRSTGSLASQDIAYSIDLGPVTVSGTGHLEMAEHDVQRRAIQSYNATISGKGTPSGAAGHSLLVDALTGDAIVGYAFTTGANAYSGTATIVSLTINFKNGAITTVDIELEVQGTPVVA